MDSCNSIESFRSELRDLMEKHNISSIFWSCSECSDTHGISDEHMMIQRDNGYSERISDGDSLDRDDL